MKNTLYKLLFLIPFVSFAQYELGYNIVDDVELNGVQPFMSKTMKMTIANSGGGDMDKTINYLDYDYEDKIAINEEAKKVKVLYHVFKHDDGFVIKDCIITGDADRIIDFYTQFWNTDLKFDEAKEKETVVNHYGNDRIALTFLSNNQAKISITSDKYKSVQEYKDFWDE